ncbi:flagellar basal-body MS-ring/collar protein FliF [Afifella sp. IM 167]|uniref:flagellar basal-body MS-ring/collar protein FliF n=1 Tax=Afifella sp. IM 167 TaxID=2033586 RepID=UPI001CCE1E16|nr:flagellar basal-body MS-ring/collar protein FliF [Afifella sp. IM 167]MBZ8131774.1 flagellar M-ring protein FliF [Afifella sp. IM 167]
MAGREQMERLWANLAGLGGRRLAALGLIGATVLIAIALGTYFLSQPERETLYTGLSREDVAQIGRVLADNGISFDASADGTSILVGYGDTARARMILAEKGLPQSGSTGYELFNDLGSFGLTSFMQDVTRVRALEGELARTIQTMDGIKAARVHLVMPDRASFRRDQQEASASVVIRTSLPDDAASAQAIRHLVAAAIPSMKAGAVTVLNTHGEVLVSGNDPSSNGGTQMAALEQRVDREIEEKIRRTLTPYLGIGNFQVSVASRLNTDRTSVSQVVFDPDSRVERSVRVVKESGNTSNSATETAASVQQNIPIEQMNGASGNSSSEQNERREELTNYEISSKRIETVQEGFRIENLSVAVLVNSERLAAAQAGADAQPEDARLAEIQQLVSSAAGIDAERGDQLKVAAVTFAAAGDDLEPVPGPGIGEVLTRQLGTVINAAAILGVAVLLILFGLRPAIRAVVTRPMAEAGNLLAGPQEAAAAVLGAPAPGAVAGPGELPSPEHVNLIEDLTSKMNRTPQKRLEQIVEYDEEQAAAILRQWMRAEGA